MKKAFVVFSRDTRSTGVNGSPQPYLNDQSQSALLGQAKELLIRFWGHNRSPQAQATISVFGTSMSDRRPAEVGSLLATPTVITPASSFRPAPIAITGPFEGFVDIRVDINAASGTNVEEFDFELHVTAILEE